MLYANKGNKQYQVFSNTDMQEYLAAGYDIIDENGAIVEHSRLKSIPYNQYEKLKTENKTLLVRIAELEAENDALRTETGKATKKEKAGDKNEAGQSGQNPSDAK